MKSLLLLLTAPIAFSMTPLTPFPGDPKTMPINNVKAFIKNSEGDGAQDGHMQARHVLSQAGGGNLNVIWTRLMQRAEEDPSINVAGGWKAGSKSVRDVLPQMVQQAMTNQKAQLAALETNQEHGVCVKVPLGGQKFYAVARIAPEEARTATVDDTWMDAPAGLTATAESPYATRNPALAAGTALATTNYKINADAGDKQITGIMMFFRKTGDDAGILKTAFPVLDCPDGKPKVTGTISFLQEKASVNTLNP